MKGSKQLLPRNQRSGSSRTLTWAVRLCIVLKTKLGCLTEGLHSCSVSKTLKSVVIFLFKIASHEDASQDYLIVPAVIFTPYKTV